MAGKPAKGFVLYVDPSADPFGSGKIVRIVASYAETELIAGAPFVIGKDNITPEFANKNPFKKQPVLQLPDGNCIFETSTICRYLATLDPAKILAGQNPVHQARINSFIDSCLDSLQPASMAWLGPILGAIDFNGEVHKNALLEVKSYLAALNTHLETRTFLVAERLSVADIFIAGTLLPLYSKVMDAQFRNPYINVNRWFECVTRQAKFVAGWDIPTSNWCTVPQKAQQKKKEKKPAAKEAPAEGKKKEEKKKKEEEPEEEEDAPKETAAKNPLDLLEKSPFVLDAFKREFSNNPIDHAMGYLWENYDDKGWAWWTAVYKYNDELSKSFMSSNLIGGFFQRLDRMRKYAFGCLGVYGTEDKHEIRGVWLLRGTDFPQPLAEVDDSELYTWTKLDHTSEESRTLIRTYLNWENVDGEMLDGKIFK